MMIESTTYNLVLAGAMNPRIHTPGWYRLVNLIDPEEMTAAINSPGTFSSQLVSQFSIGDIDIFCFVERWEIRTSNVDRLERIKSMAVKIFDEILPHTPVSHFGFNIIYVRKTGCPNVGVLLAKWLARTPLKLSEDSLAYGEITLKRRFEDNQRLISIKSPQEDDAKGFLVFAVNYECVLKSDGFFYIDKIINKEHPAIQSESEQELVTILRSIELESAMEI